MLGWHIGGIMSGVHDRALMKRGNMEREIHEEEIFGRGDFHDDNNDDDDEIILLIQGHHHHHHHHPHPYQITPLSIIILSRSLTFPVPVGLSSRAFCPFSKALTTFSMYTSWHS